MSLLMMFRPQDTHDGDRAIEYVFEALRKQYEEQIQERIESEPEKVADMIIDNAERIEKAKPHLDTIRKIEAKQEFFDAEYLLLMQELQKLEALRESLEKSAWEQKMLEGQRKRAALFAEIKRLEQEIELEEFFIFCALIN